VALRARPQRPQRAAHRVVPRPEANLAAIPHDLHGRRLGPASSGSRLPPTLRGQRECRPYPGSLGRVRGPRRNLAQGLRSDLRANRDASQPPRTSATIERAEATHHAGSARFDPIQWFGRGGQMTDRPRAMRRSAPVLAGDDRTERRAELGLLELRQPRPIGASVGDRTAALSTTSSGRGRGSPGALWRDERRERVTAEPSFGRDRRLRGLLRCSRSRAWTNGSSRTRDGRSKPGPAPVRTRPDLAVAAVRKAVPDEPSDASSVHRHDS